MTAPTRYEIRTVADFIAVPSDRIEAMAEDFASFLTIHAEVAALGLSDVTQRRDVFIWIDDGEHDMHVKIDFDTKDKS